MKKTVSVTANISRALRNRLAKEAMRQGKTMSAFLEDQLSFAYYGRGRKADKPQYHKSFLDKPMPPHVEKFNKENQNIH